MLAFPEGAAPEIVDHGDTGLLVADEGAMAAAVHDAAAIDPARCRAAAQRFAPDRVAAGYETVYRRAAAPVIAPQPIPQPLSSMA